MPGHRNIAGPLTRRSSFIKCLIESIKSHLELSTRMVKRSIQVIYNDEREYLEIRVADLLWKMKTSRQLLLPVALIGSRCSLSQGRQRLMERGLLSFPQRKRLLSLR
ncbi:hypothetical protein TNIN_472421 [Trichonephila inaurata madagascariensis]|uniref:Uncharacterized protein n=1 Tax=Trichonephila inaurata madagascariensis TaxID=2747483 RepID=A0A8X7C2E3_9ARAC|nr:hypothetical protein TNIN_472421 [Trichonephila inaurata madagascariensis]